MQKIAKIIAIIVAISAAPPAHADNIFNTAQLAAQACVNGLTGRLQDNSFLLASGFQQRGTSFVRRATNLGLSGHTDRASIRIRRDRCEFSYGTNRGSHSAYEVFQNVFRELGFRELSIRSGNRQYPAFERNGLITSAICSSGSDAQQYLY